LACLAPPNRESFNSTHVYGTHVPVEEPSTASKGDIAGSVGGCVLYARGDSIFLGVRIVDDVDPPTVEMPRWSGSSRSWRVRRSLCEGPLTHGAAFTSWRCPEAAALKPGGRALAAQKFATAATMAALVSERRSCVPNSSSSCRFTIDP